MPNVGFFLSDVYHRLYICIYLCIYVCLCLLIYPQPYMNIYTSFIYILYIYKYIDKYIYIRVTQDDIAKVSRRFFIGQNKCCIWVQYVG